MQPSSIHALTRGAVAGAAASVPQAVVGKVEELILLPPSEDSNIAPRLIDRLGRMIGEHPSPTQKWLLGSLYHVGYGAGWGAMYGLAADRFRPPPMAGGALLGALIYGITFPRWGAAVLTGTERPPESRSSRMTVVAWSVALTFGVATGVLYDVLARGGAGGVAGSTRSTGRGAGARTASERKEGLRGRR